LPNERAEKRRRPRQRSDDDLDRVRDEWVSRYNSRARALRTLGLSVGTPTEEIDARYKSLIGELANAPASEEQRAQLRRAYAILKEE
jgi:hypothetical protein